MSTPRIGYIGENFDLQISQGRTFGPMKITLLNPDKSPVNLTGCQIRGQIKKTAGAAVIAAFDVSITDYSGGKFEFGLTDEVSATIVAGESIDSDESLYFWDMEIEDSLGRILPLYFGSVFVFRRITNA